MVLISFWIYLPAVLDWLSILFMRYISFEIWISFPLWNSDIQYFGYGDWFQKRYSQTNPKITREENSNVNSKSFLPYCSLFSSFRDTFGRAILDSLRVQSNPKQTGFRVERGRQNLPNDDKLGYISHCKNDLNVLINTLCT